MKQLIYLFSLFLFTNCATITKVELPTALSEASGLVYYNETFLAINDSDNSPIIYFFDDKGKLKHQVFIGNAVNWDWEALTIANENLYIGDIGNNLNSRQDLRVLEVSLSQIFEKDTVNAETIQFSYSAQSEFPPSKENLYYDAEAMIVQNGKIYIFTKNRTVPFDGISKVYSFPLEKGNHIAQFEYDLQLPATNWQEESITGGFLYEEKLYLLTYSKIYILNQSADKKWEIESHISHKEFTQKEGITVTKTGIYVVDEVSHAPFQTHPENKNFLYFYKNFR